MRLSLQLALYQVFAVPVPQTTIYFDRMWARPGFLRGYYHSQASGSHHHCRGQATRFMSSCTQIPCAIDLAPLIGSATDQSKFLKSFDGNC